MQLKTLLQASGQSMPSHTAPAALVASPAAHHITSWEFWQTWFSARPLWFTYTAKSQNMSAAKFCSCGILLLVQPFIRKDFSRHTFWFSAPSVWNWAPQTVLISDSLVLIQLETFLFWTLIQSAASTSEVITIWCYKSSNYYYLYPR